MTARSPSPLRALWLAGTILVAPSAWAQGAAPKSEPALSQVLHGAAKNAYDVASLLYKQGDFAGAEAKYGEAYDLQKDPRLIFNMAACERGRHAYARMKALLERYRREAGESLSAEDKKTVDDALAALGKLVGTVVVSVSVQGAVVTVDGESAGTAPLAGAVVLDPGHHTVVVRKEGYESFERPIEISAGIPTSLTVTLVVQPTAPASTQVESVSRRPSADVGPAPRLSPLVYAGFGLAAAGVVVGSITGGLAIAKASTVGSQCHNSDCPTSVDGDLHSGLTFATVSTVSFIAAGVGAAVGVVAWVLSPRREAAATGAAVVEPWVGLGSAGVRGTF
jgi:hypothetical protein